MKIIGTTETSYHLEQVIRQSEEILLIVSPYLRITKRLKVELEDAFDRCKNNIIVYRESQLDRNEFEWLKGFSNLNLIPVENLHAKCYINEKVAILSSMNLYEYSQINNHELSVISEVSEDRDFYLQLVAKVYSILRTAGINFDFKYFEQLGRYTMSDLFKKLDEKYSFRYYGDDLDAAYKFISLKAMELTAFHKDEIYQDKSAILRKAFLGKERFELLYKELSKLGRPKQSVPVSPFTKS